MAYSKVEEEKQDVHGNETLIAVPLHKVKLEICSKWVFSKYVDVKFLWSCPCKR